MAASPTHRSVFGTDDDTPDVRVRRMAEMASAQARVVGRRADEQRSRRRVFIAVGSGMGVVGLVASVVVALWNGTAAADWKVLVPTWTLIAASIGALTRNRDDLLATLGGRSAGTAELARRLARAIGTRTSRVEDYFAVLAGMEPITALVEQDVKATSASLNALRTGGGRRRRHRRIVPRERRVVVSTVDGRRLRATIDELSLSGVAMTEALPRLSDGESVLIGRTWASVARQWEGGIAFRFETELDASTFDEEVVL